MADLILKQQADEDGGSFLDLGIKDVELLTLQFDQDAIRAGLQGPDRERVRGELVSIITQEHSLMQRRVHVVGKGVDSIPKGKGDALQLELTKRFSNYRYQIEAVRLLEPLVEDDDLVFSTLLDAAFGFNQIGSLANRVDAVIDVLSRNGGKRKQYLTEFARNPNYNDWQRVIAYEVLMLRGLTKDTAMYDMLCRLAVDNSILELYREGVLSPQARFWYDSESRRKDETPGKTDDEIRDFAARKAQTNFRLKIFEIMEYLLDRGQCRGKLGTASRSEREPLTKGLTGELSAMDTNSLTEAMCGLIENHPSYQAIGLCIYAQQVAGLSQPELKRINQALQKIKGNDCLLVSQGYVNHTLDFLARRMRV